MKKITLSAVVSGICLVLAIGLLVFWRFQGVPLFLDDHSQTPAGALSDAPPAAQPVPQNFKLSDRETKARLVQTIEAQLVAFRDNDYPKAYTFAATGIQATFTPAAFEAMVKQQYPDIAFWRDAAFGAALDNGEEAVMDLVIKDSSGQSGRYQYYFKRETDSWKISGVIASADPMAPDRKSKPAPLNL